MAPCSVYLQILILILGSVECTAFISLSGRGSNFEFGRESSFSTSSHNDGHYHRHVEFVKYITSVQRLTTSLRSTPQYKSGPKYRGRRKQAVAKEGPYVQRKLNVGGDSGTTGDTSKDSITSVLQQCNFGGRLSRIDHSDLPLIGEIHADGRWQLCIITGFKVPSSVEKNAGSSGGDGRNGGRSIEISPPLAKVLIIEKGVNYNNDKMVGQYSSVVDIGQITCIWNEQNEDMGRNVNTLNDLAMELSKYLTDLVDSSIQKLPVNQIEKSLQGLYEKCVKGPAAKGKGLTKKDVSKISSTITPIDRAQHLEQILRKALKAGLHGKKCRLVDSNDMLEFLFEGRHSNGVRGSKHRGVSIVSRLVGASLLARDAELGGRFKRSGCIFVSAKYDTPIKSPSLCDISILNGGWTAVDASVRTGTEARKFAERRSSGGTDAAAFTSADERILHRLELLAMGKVLEKGDGSKQLELDLRETLSAMNLPLTATGAQQALIQSGRWSLSKNTSKQNKKTFEPWSEDVLQAATKLVYREEQRKKQICRELVKNGSKLIEDRINLTALPAITIDAKRASFRDDAIGVRLRSSTGRKVVKSASKWEILVHIADVSDLYSPNIAKLIDDIQFLRQAAESRGVSRYDLPFGPLHLMPPVALEALALVTKDIDGKNKSTEKWSPVNRCVTLWAYIDERNGRLLDAGVERSLISAPIALTFDSASKILNDEITVDSASIKTAKAVLSIAERNLSLWKGTRLKTEKAAAQREKRLQMKELIAKEIVHSNDMRDDGADGSFQRTRGHRLVDQSLDLYGSTISKLLAKQNAPIPRASGSMADRDGRVATAPLRRYIDGLAQRQALSVLCSYGGPAMTKKDCAVANKQVNDATNRVQKFSVAGKGNGKRERALQMLERHLSATGNSKERIIPALSTGKQNEVVLSGLGLVVKCMGVKGSLRSGQRVLVEVTELNAKRGIIQVNLIKRSYD